MDVAGESTQSFVRYVQLFTDKITMSLRSVEQGGHHVHAVLLNVFGLSVVDRSQ